MKLRLEGLLFAQVLSKAQYSRFSTILLKRSPNKIKLQTTPNLAVSLVTTREL